MSVPVEHIADHIRHHRCFSHPIFEHWSNVAPDAVTIGALFHQIQNFCASTRPGGCLPDSLRALDLEAASDLLEAIVESEANHGPELATMAGFIVNRAAGREVCPDLSDQNAVESRLKEFSDRLLGSLPGYDQETGLTVQARRAIAVFERRYNGDRESTLRNIGTALALEMISNRHLIPGEKRCLVDSQLYGATLETPEMHYLLEHWGEAGAEHQHEKNAFEAARLLLDGESEPLIMEGVNDFLDTLANLWDVLDSALLQSGYSGARAA